MWQKVLYKAQNYELNYMPYNPIIYTKSNHTFYDLMRCIQSITNVFILFSIHLTLTPLNIEVYMYLLYLTFITLFFFLYKVRTKRVIHLSCIIILWCYILTPIIQTLTREIHSDTIYMYYFLLNLLYCIDLTKTNILNEVNQRNVNNDLNENPSFIPSDNMDKNLINESINRVNMKVLSLEDTYSNYRMNNISTFGYNCNIIASILLCSRYQTRDMVFFTLWFNLICSMGLPYLSEAKGLHRKIHFVMAHILSALFLTVIVDINLFCIYLLLVIALIGTSLLSLFY